jgi:hypothetical protein
MTKQEQIEHFTNFTNSMAETIIRKGNDYAGADRLSNFKATAEITGTSPASVCLTMIGIKVARLGVLINSGAEPANESVRDSVLDLANYAALLDMILAENRPPNE